MHYFWPLSMRKKRYTLVHSHTFYPSIPRKSPTNTSHRHSSNSRRFAHSGFNTTTIILASFHCENDTNKWREPRVTGSASQCYWWFYLLALLPRSCERMASFHYTQNHSMRSECREYLRFWGRRFLGPSIIYRRWCNIGSKRVTIFNKIKYGKVFLILIVSEMLSVCFFFYVLLGYW